MTNKIKTVIGVDPGMNAGGVAFLDVETGALKCFSTPTYKTTVKRKVKGKVKDVERRDIDRDAFRELFENNCNINESLFYGERVHAGAFGAKSSKGVSAGSVSSFTFATAAEAPQSIICGMGMDSDRRRLVLPQVWKKHFGLGNDKSESISLACKLFPCNVEDFTVNKDTGRKKAMDGLAEAALIALYGARQEGLVAYGKS